MLLSGSWTPQEEKNFAKFILNEGKRWSKVARSMNTHRTEHMVKNKYKTIMIKLKKQYPEVKNEESLLKCFIRDLDEVNRNSPEVEKVEEELN